MASLGALVAALGLALVHLLADRVHSAGRTARLRWLSFAGGTSVAFVFIHLIPELQRAQRAVVQELGEAIDFLEHHVFLAALVGVVLYYGAEHAALRRSVRDGRRGRQSGAGEPFFWVHIALFVVFNALMGHLLTREAPAGWSRLAILWFALALHFFANDFALRQHHREDYHRIGRWLLAGGVLAGWVSGTFLPLPESAVALPLAIAAGGIVLNALKEELPAQREGRFWAFALGAGAYTGLMLVE